MNEHRTDHQIRGEAADERPARPVPCMHDLHLDPCFRTSTLLDQLPHDVHPSCHPPHVTVADFARGTVDAHFGYPPRGEIDCAEGAPGSHLDQAAIEQTDPAVVRQDRGPAAHAAGDGKHSREWRMNDNAIDGPHYRLRPAYPPL